MLIRKINNCDEIIAGDSTRLRELLHPDRDYPFDGHYSLSHAVVVTGQKSRRHRLHSNEVYYIISGQGRMNINNETVSVEPGDTINIPAGSVQWIENLSQDDLVFLCIVDPAWKIENEEIL